MLPAAKCAEILGLNSPDVSYLERRRAYIKAALVMSRLVGPSTPWSERAELARRGANSFADVEAAFEGLRSARDAPPGFAPDDFLPQLRCSSDGGRSFDASRPAISAMLHAEVRAPEMQATEWEISVKFSTTRFLLSRSLEDFVQLHRKLKQRVPACARALPPLPHHDEVAKLLEARRALTHGSYSQGQSSSILLGAFFSSPLLSEDGEEFRKADAIKGVTSVTRKLRSWLAQAIDWFRARRAYDPDLLEFIDLDAELLLRLHREDMRVVRNVVVSWGGHVVHAVPSTWVHDFVTSITPKRGKSSHSKTMPGPIRVRECLDQMTASSRESDPNSLDGRWDVVTKPAWVIISAVYGADIELDLDTLRKILLQKGLSSVYLDKAPTALLGLPVGTA